MEFDIDVRGFESLTSGKKKKEIKELIKKSMQSVALEWESECKRIIQDGALDTGEFANSIHTEMFEDGDSVGFIGMDGVSYGIYWEYGTEKHWVPFFSHGDINKPVLADWGRRVLGLTDEEMLKQGGLEVQIPELSPFMKSMLKAQSESSEIFKETFMEAPI